MREGPSLAPIAALAGDPARANMLAALLSGKALTASELANEANVTAQTASSHLAKLEAGGLVSAMKQRTPPLFPLPSPMPKWRRCWRRCWASPRAPAICARGPVRAIRPFARRVSATTISQGRKAWRCSMRWRGPGISCIAAKRCG